MNEHMTYGVEVDTKTYEKIELGEITKVTIEITEDNQFDLLDSSEETLILNVVALPLTFHSCFFWNNGAFPYSVNPRLKFLCVAEKGPKDDILEMMVHIKKVTPVAGRRFDYGSGKANANGDSCHWLLDVEFDMDFSSFHNTYVMRWNPGISSSKIEDFRAARKKWPDGFVGDWSIYEWQEADEGDRYFMVRVGDGPNGIVHDGYFRSEPYEGDDWAGKGYTRHYVDITIEHPCDPDEPCVTIEQLEEAIPEICWRRGHSGELLTKEQAEKLEKLFEGKMR